MDDTISRQEAIDALIELYEYQRDIDPTEAADLVRQGVYLAEKKIEQLSAVPTCDDAVSRQAAITILDAWLRVHGGAYGKGLSAARELIADLPAVQSQQIVRCKDCMHNGSFDTDCPINWNGKEYCSFAERRTNG